MIYGQTGYVLTTLNITSVFVLTIIIPWIVRHLRPLYKRKQLVGLVEDNLTPDGDGDSSSCKPENVVSETSDHLDVHITIGSWIIESLAYIAVATMTTLASQLAGLSVLTYSSSINNVKTQPITAVVCIGFGVGRLPVFRSLVAATVDPLEQGNMSSIIFFGAED